MIRNKNYKHQTDEQLVKNFKRTKSPRIISEIYNRYSRLVYGICLKMLKSKPDALDAVNGIFEKLIQKLSNQNIDNFNSWLYTFSKNYCLESLRKQQRRREIFSIYTKEYQAQNIFQHIDNNKSEHLSFALQQLPSHQQNCIRLFYFDNLSYQEICHQTGLNQNQVKSFLQNGRRNLKIALKSN